MANGMRLIPFVVDKKLYVDFHVKFSAVVDSMQASGCKLAVDFSSIQDESFSVHRLLGVDLLKFLDPMQLTCFMNVSAFRLPQGLVPFGGVADFLVLETITQVNRAFDIHYNLIIMLQDEILPFFDEQKLPSRVPDSK